MKQLKVCLLVFLVLACSKDDAANLSLDEQLLGKWTLTNYYSDSYFPDRSEGRIEKIVPEETDYAIEFTDDQNKIVLSGFLRYSFEGYEIVDGEKEITYQATNFMDAEQGEGYHTGEWKIENGLLICTDVSSQEGEVYSTTSSIKLSGDTLVLTLDNSQFGIHQTGETIVEYIRE